MAEDDPLPPAFALLARAASQVPPSSSSSFSGMTEEDTLMELHYFFGSFNRSKTSPHDLDVESWKELAKQGVSLNCVIQGLLGVMEKGGKLGLVAADVYLGLLLAPGCPLYSLFSQVGFTNLLRCMRNSCKPSSSSAANDQERFGAMQEKQIGKGKGGKKRVKRPAGKQLGAPDIVDGDDDSAGHREADFSNNQVAVEAVCQILVKLQATLVVLHLKEHQESLRSLIELLTDLPHLALEMQADKDEAVQCKAKKTSIYRSGSCLSICNLAFELMITVLEPCHGNPMDTAVILLKLLAPGILLTCSEGSHHQKVQIRDQCLDFITGLLKNSSHQAMAMAVAALPRYLAMKAPEKAEPRALAVEAVMVVVKALPLQDQINFGHFVAKLSRGKPRHRLFAIDLATCLLGALPDPLGLDREEQQDNAVGQEEEPIEVNPVNIEARNTPLLKSKAKGRDTPLGAPSIPSTKAWWGTACLEALLHRCSDKVPSIRARALSNLAQALEVLSFDIRNRVVLQSLLGFGTMASKCSKQQEFSIRKSALMNAWQTPGRVSPSLGGHTPSPEPSAVGPSASPLSPGAGHGDLGSLLRRRCLDEKVAVRKSTLVLMTKSASLLGRPPDETMLEAMGSACADPMVSIRKTAIGALSEMVRKFPADTKVVKEWLHSALPLVMDNESSLQDEVVSLFEELVCDRIAFAATSRLPGCIPKSSHMNKKGEVPAKPNADLELERLLPPGILVVLNGMADDSSVTSCMKRVCTSLGKKNRIRAGIALALQNIITASRTLWCSYHNEDTSIKQGWTAPLGAWLLLSEVSSFVPKAVSWDFLRNHWKILEKQVNVIPGQATPGADQNHSAAWATDRVYLLQTISNVALELPPDAAADLAAELLERLEGFCMDPTEVGAHVKALHMLCIRKAASAEEGDRLVSTWVEDLLRQAGLILDTYVKSLGVHGLPDASDLSEAPKSCCRNQKKSCHGNGPQTQGCKLAESSHQVITAIFTVGALVLICPQAKAGDLVTSLQAIVTSNHIRPKDLVYEGSNKDASCGVSAQVWVTLGKLCLTNYDLAKRCIPLFLQELERSDSAPVRNNIMVAMTDFCVRYTALIDGYIHKLTKSLRDPCELVRRQGFVLLAQLLQRDYLKWRGTLFHRFLLALVDESDKISHMANFLFGSILKSKAPLLAYNSFVETIFTLNDCHAHSGHTDVLQIPQSEREMFSLRGKGEAVVEKRMHIYMCLLKEMAPEHLLATSAKLCADILAAAADGLLNLDDPTAQCVLEDSLKILSLKEMRLGGKQGAAVPDSLDIEEEGAAAFAAAKGRVVTQLAKRNLVQNAIPIFIELKRLLESKNSPLTGMLMECMRVMLKEYKNEMEEILVADKQLQKEIMYDMQKHEAHKAKAKVVAAASVVRSSPGSVLHQRNSSAENSGDAAAKSSLHKKVPTLERGKQYGDGKENLDRKGKGLATNDEGANRTSSLSRMSKRKAFLSPEPSRVKWLDRDMHGGEASHSAVTPTVASSLQEAVEGEPRLKEQNVASAVANVVAEATAAAVLSEVAKGSSTPLQVMALPKLHSTVPSTVKKASFQAAGDGEEGEALASLASVRRRQSFSSMDLPGESQ